MNRSQRIKSALRAARLQHWEEFSQLLEPITLEGRTIASMSERWLAAEAAYVKRNYAKTLALYDALEQDSKFRASPAWQRFRSSHRRCFAHFQRGEYSEANQVLLEAKERQKDLSPNEQRVPHLEAMQGHFLELRGEFEPARTRFQIAYEQALQSKNWDRAASAAADVGRVLGILGRPADGLTWISKGEEAEKNAQNILIARTLQIRRALLNMASGRTEEAEGLLDRLISACQDKQTPEVAMSAFEARADLYELNNQTPKAQHVLQKAIQGAVEGGFRRHEAYLRVAMAHLLANQGNTPAATKQFLSALNLGLQLDPPQPKVLVDLAEDLLEQPELAGTPSYQIRQKLRIAVDRMAESIRVSLHRHAIRERRFRTDFERLLFLVKALTMPKLELASSVVHLTTGQVRHGDGRNDHISEAQIMLLMLLKSVSSPLSTRQIATRLEITEDNAKKRIERLRKALGEKNVLTVRKGNSRVHHIAYSKRLDAQG